MTTGPPGLTQWRRWQRSGRSEKCAFSGARSAMEMEGQQISLLQRPEKEVEARKKNCLVEEGSLESSSVGESSSSPLTSLEEEEVESKEKGGSFESLDSLDNALPIKRGLSSFFSGKSKSFTSLADAASMNASDLEKPENPFSKRRRILTASKARRASSYTSLPPLVSEGNDRRQKERERERERGR